MTRPNFFEATRAALRAAFVQTGLLIRALFNGKAIGRWWKALRSRSHFIPRPWEVRNTINNLQAHERYTIGLLAVVIAVSLFGIGSYLYLSNTQAVPTEGGEYREGVVGLPRFINPVLAPTNDADRDITRLVYASLLKYNASGELTPDLAESYELVDDGTTYRFKLRENLKWEDGTPLTAEDIIFTVRTIQDARYSSPLITNWRGVEVGAEGSDRVIIRISSSYTPFTENLTLPILPKHIWGDIDPKSFALADANLEPTGSGPFVVEKFTKDSSGFVTSYTLKRNENYHGKTPFLNRVSFRFYASEDDAIKAYNNRAVDGLSSVSALSLEKIANKGVTEIREFHLPRLFAVFFNAERNTLLAESSVRQALTHATDRDAIINNVLGGYASPALTPIPPALASFYAPDVATRTFNPDEARRLLEEADYTDTDGDGIRQKGDTPLSFTVVTAPSAETVQVATILASQWREVGVELLVSTPESGVLEQAHIRPRNYDMLLYGEIMGAIPDPYPFWHSSQIDDPGLNLARYNNKSVDTVLEAARKETSFEQRVALYRQFQELVAKDTPAVFLYDPTYLYVVNKAVRGITGRLIVDPSHRFSDIEQWYIETRREF
jgi:peptide/nickel transport system substrate-binding protein